MTELEKTAKGLIAFGDAVRDCNKAMPRCFCAIEKIQYLPDALVLARLGLVCGSIRMKRYGPLKMFSNRYLQCLLVLQQNG